MPTHPPRGLRDWLPLGPASRLLGVDADTLRRWADDGRVETFLTPGGHRRFARAALEAAIAARTVKPVSLDANDGLTERYSAAYRRRFQRPPREARRWVDQLGDDDVAMFRARGRQLVGTLMAYLQAPSIERPRLLAAAEAHGRAYGESAARAGIPLHDAIAAFVRARRPFLDQLAAACRQRSVSVGEATHLFEVANAALDRVLLALVAGHYPRRRSIHRSPREA